MTDEKYCPTKLLNDEPAEIDEFGSHEKVANAILDLILSEDGGKSVAITGSWGSGKSTVIKLLEKKLHKTKQNIEMFVFDAWAHEGDPLRRSFLTNLIDFLIKKKRIRSTDYSGLGGDEPKSWIDVKNILLKRLKIEKTTTLPKFTLASKFFLGLSILIPIGAALISTAPDTWIIWPIIGGIMCLLPVVVAFSVMIIGWCLNRLLNDNEIRKSNSCDSFAIFVNRAKTETTNIFTETPDPTSIEFQDIFCGLMNKSLLRDKKLIIVIDNLDRVSQDDALSIWATMRTFFDACIKSSEAWSSNLWLLVPFDPTSMRRLWDNTQNSSEQKNNDSISDNKDFMQSFIDKTFQIVFDVAPPIQSDWQKFMKLQLQSAFDKRHEDDFYAIIKIFAIKRPKKIPPPTPREIKLFVNKIGSLHRQWNDVIPLRIMAFFVTLNQNSKWDANVKLVKPERDIIFPIPSDLLGANIRENLAALYFNVPADRAIQVLLSDPIRNAITTGQFDTLHKQTHIDGFTILFEEIVEDYRNDFSRSRMKEFANTIYILDKLNLSDDDNTRRIWKILYEVGNKIEYWPEMNSNDAEAISALLRRFNDQKFATQLIQSIASSKLKETTPEDIKRWLGWSATIIRNAKSLNHEEVIDNTFRVPASAELYIAIINILSESKEHADVVKYFRPSVDSMQVTAEIIQSVINNNSDKRLNSIISTLLEIPLYWAWNTIVSAIEAKITANPTLTSSEIATLVISLLILDSKPTNSGADEALRRLTTQDHMMHIFYQAIKERDWKTSALCTIPILEYKPSGALMIPSSSPNIEGAPGGYNNYIEIMKNPDADPEIVKETGNAVIYLSRIEKLFSIEDETPKKFIKSVLRSIVLTYPQSHQHISPQLILDNFGLLNEALNKDNQLDKLIAGSIENSNLVSFIIKEGFLAENVSLYKIVLSLAKGEHKCNLAEFIITGMQVINKDFWLSEFKRRGDIIHLIMNMVDDELEINLTHEFQDALLSLTDSIIEETESIDELVHKWGTTIPFAMAKDARKTFSDRLRDKLLVNDEKRSIEIVLRLYGDFLLESNIFTERVKEIVRYGFVNIIGRNPLSLIELTWLMHAFEKYNGTINNCEKATLNDFRGRIESMKDDQVVDENARIILSKIWYYLVNGGS